MHFGVLLRYLDVSSDYEMLFREAHLHQGLVGAGGTGQSDTSGPLKSKILKYRGSLAEPYSSVELVHHHRGEMFAQ